MTSKQIYDLLVSFYKKFHPEFSNWGDKMSKDLQDQLFKSFISDLLFSRVDPAIGLEALRITSTKGITYALELPEIKNKSLEIINLMEQAKDWEEFHKLEKTPPPEKKQTDFDKLLGAIMKVPKPKKDKKPKEDQ